MGRFITLLLLISCYTYAVGTERQFKEFEYKGETIDYAIQLPNNFDPSNTYPVMIGPSEAEGPDDQSFYWRGIKDTRGWILVDYQIYDYGNRKKEVQAFLDYLMSEYKIEGNKFHTVCFSANSAGIFDMVIDIPEYFHSITGMAGNPATTDKAKLGKMKNVKVQFVGGDRDSYWMRTAKNRHQQLLEVGVDSRIEIIKNGQHVLKKLIGNGFLARAEKMRQLNSK